MQSPIKKIKVLFPFVGDSVGGSHWSAINLYKELIKRHDIDVMIVLHIPDSPLSKLLDRIGIPYTILSTSTLAGESDKVSSIVFSMVANLLLIYRFIKDNKVNIVHGNDLRINLTWSLPTRLSLSKYIWHQRQLLSKSAKWSLIRFLSNHVVAISIYVYKTLPGNISGNKKTIINNPFDTSVIYDKKISREEIYSRYKIDKSNFLLGYVGRLVSWKDVDTILKSLHKILISTPHKLDIHLLIVGDGDFHYRQSLKSFVEFNGLKGHVTFSGFVDDASYVLSAIDLLIAPSINEPFGRVLVESMLQKTLVLASNSGAHGSIVEHNKTGFLFNVSSADSLSYHLLNIIKNKDNHSVITDLAYDNSVKLYSSDIHTNNIVDVYRGLSNKRLD